MQDYEDLIALIVELDLPAIDLGVHEDPTKIIIGVVVVSIEMHFFGLDDDDRVDISEHFIEIFQTYLEVEAMDVKA